MKLADKLKDDIFDFYNSISEDADDDLHYVECFHSSSGLDVEIRDEISSNDLIKIFEIIRGSGAKNIVKNRINGTSYVNVIF